MHLVVIYLFEDDEFSSIKQFAYNFKYSHTVKITHQNTYLLVHVRSIHKNCNTSVCWTLAIKSQKRTIATGYSPTSHRSLPEIRSAHNQSDFKYLYFSVGVSGFRLKVLC